MYRVIEPFFDLMDGNRQYLPGDVYPREGFPVSVERVKELATNSNRLGYPVIEEVQEQRTEKAERPKPRKRAKEDAD